MTRTAPSSSSAGLVVEDLVETGAIRGAALLEGIGTFQEALDSL